MERKVCCTDVEDYLKHIKKYYEYEKEGVHKLDPQVYANPNGGERPEEKKGIFSFKDIYLHWTDVKNKDSILENGLQLKYDKRSIDYNSEEDPYKIMAPRIAGVRPFIPLGNKSIPNEMAVFIIDTKDLKKNTPCSAPHYVYVWEDIRKEQILGWYVVNLEENEVLDSGVNICE